MGKNKPLLWTAILSAAGAGSAFAAQEDVTTSIVNPTVDGFTGWSESRPKGGNGPLLGEDKMEYYAGNASDRKTASFDYYQEIENLPNGVYSVSAEMYNSLNGESGATWGASSGVYAKSSNGEVRALVTADGTELKSYTTPLILVSDGKLRIGVKNVSEMKARWFVADNFKLTYYGGFVSASNFDDASADGFVANTGTIGFASTANSIGAVGHSMESWNGTAANNKFDFAKQFTLKKGTYHVLADMFNSFNGVAGAEDAGQAGMYVTIGKDTQKVLCPTTTTDGPEAAKNFTLQFELDEDQTVTIGFKNFETMKARWFVCDNFALTMDPDDLKALQDELTTLLATQINKAAIYTEDETLQGLAVNASAIQAKINDLGADVTKYSSIKEEIEAIGEKISKAAANYDQYAKAVKEYNTLMDLLGDIEDTKANSGEGVNEGDEGYYRRTDDDTTLAYIYYNAAATTQAAAKNLYDNVLTQVATFKGDVETAYEAGNAGSVFADENLESIVKNLKDVVANACDAINNGSTAALLYANVKTAIAEANNAYTTISNDIYEALITDADAKIEKVDGVYIYNDKYVQALSELQVQVRKIQAVETANEAQYAGEVEDKDKKTQEQFLAELKSYVDEMGNIRDKYIYEATELRGYYTDACKDLKTKATDYLKSEITDHIGTKRSKVLTYFTSKIKAIQKDIDAIQAKIDAANKAHTIGATPYAEYAEELAAVIDKIDLLKNSGDAEVSDVTKAVNEYDANAATLAEIKKVEDEFKLRQSGAGKKNALDDDDNYTGVENMKSADGKLALKDKFDDIEAQISADIAALRTAANAVYKINGLGTAGQFDESQDGDVNPETGEILYKGTASIYKEVGKYKTIAENTLETYNTIAAAVQGYTDALEGTPEVKDKDGNVTAAKPGLVGTATNTAVTIDAATYPQDEENATAAISGTTYAAKIAELRKQIAAINTAVTGALTKTGEELKDSLDEIQNGDPDVAPFPVTLNAAIATEISTLTDNYEANETAWTGAQQLAAKVRLLDEAERSMNAIKLKLPATYDAATYGKVADKNVDDKTKALNDVLAAIQKEVQDVQNNIDAARTADASEAIALLSEIQDDITDINKQVSALNTRAEAAKTAYDAEKTANTALLDRIALLGAKLNGTVLDEVDYTGVKETLAPADDTKFDDEIAAVQTSLDQVASDLGTSFAAETVVTDQKDTKDKSGKVTKKGYDTLLDEAETAINNLIDPLAKNESANQTAYNQLQKDITAAKYAEKSAAVLAEINDDTEGKVIATGVARAFYKGKLDEITTAYNKNFVGDNSEAYKAYTAVVKSTLAGAIKDEAKYTDTDKNMVAKYNALKAVLDKAVADAEALPGLADANERAHNELVADYETANKDWSRIFNEISGAETSQAHENAIATLTNLKERLTAFNTTLADKFGKGLCGTDKVTLDTEITDIQNKLNELDGSWKETYDAAVTADNKARKDAFDDAYAALTQTYQADVATITKMSKLSYASGDKATEKLLEITGDGGIYDYAQLIRDLKAKAAAEYAAVTKSEETDLYDPEELNKQTANKYANEIKNLTDTYTTEVNNIAGDTYDVKRGEVDKQYNGADNGAVTALMNTLGYTQDQAEAALSDVKKILDDAAAARSKQDFAYLLDTEILPAFSTVEDKIAADKEAAAEAAWFAATSAASNLARTEAEEIAEFLGSEGKGEYSDEYAEFIKVLDKAAEKWADIKGSKFDGFSGAKGVLDGFLSKIDTHGNAINIGTEEKPVYAEHTEIYWQAYDKDKSLKANDTAYDTMLEYISDAQAVLDKASEYVGTLIIEHDADLNDQFEARQNDIKNYRSAADCKHNNGTASSYVDQIEKSYQSFVAQVDPTIYNEAVTKEKVALAQEIGLLKTDWDKAAAAIINSDDMDLIDRVNGYRDLYEEYAKENETIAQNYKQVLDEDGMPVWEKDENGDYILDEDNERIAVRVSADDTHAAFLALEKKIANSKADLAKIYDEAASGNAANEVQAGIDGLQATYDALTKQLAECHEPVQAKYADEVEALKVAIDAAQAELEKEKAENTVLLYAENNLTSIEKAAEAVEGLSDQIATDELPYDVNDANHDILTARITTLTESLNAVYNDAVENHEYYATGEYSLIVGYDENGEAIYDKYEIYRDYQKASIERTIASYKSQIEDSFKAIDLQYGIYRNWYQRQLNSVATSISDLDKSLKSYNAGETISTLGDAMADAWVAYGSNNYAPEDRADLYSALDNAYEKYENLYNYNADAQDGWISKDIDGNYIEWTEVDAEGVEQTYSTDPEAENYNGYKPVVYTEEYDAIMARAKELEEFASAFVQEVDAKAWKRGDVNRDGKINVIDYAAVRNIVLNVTEVSETDPIFYAADVNQDGVITIADVTGIANYIMGNNTWKTGYGVKAFGAGATEDAIELAVVGSGSKQQIVISLNNSRNYVGAQMDIELPAGVSIVGESLTSRAQGHELLSNDVNGKHRILISSINNPEFNNSESALVVLDVEVSGSYSGGDIAVTGIKVAEANARTRTLADVVLGGEATGIAELSTSEKIVDKIYSAGGQLMNALKKGINIIRNSDGTTKKVLVK